MIKFKLDFVNPWKKDIDDYTKHYIVYEPRLTENWAMEFQISRFSPYSIFNIELDLAWRGEDHAGPGIKLEIWSYMFSLRLYNVNHWDYETGTWEKSQ